MLSTMQLLLVYLKSEGFRQRIYRWSWRNRLETNHLIGILASTYMNVVSPSFSTFGGAGSSTSRSRLKDSEIGAYIELVSNGSNDNDEHRLPRESRRRMHSYSARRGSLRMIR